MSTTFIIPIKVESPDRERNIKASVRYLLKNTSSRIIIKEVDSRPLIPSILKNEIKSDRIQYYFEVGTSVFHRTRYLNDMLQMCNTPVVCNYDADVILHPGIYSVAERAILAGECDAVYPYPESDTGQIRLYFTPESEKNFLCTSNFESLKESQVKMWRAHAGFCFFISKQSYIHAGAENENFVSWGPEDGERITRFSKMGLRIARIDHPVVHMEHSRSADSDDRNPHAGSNCELFSRLSQMSSNQLSLYLDSQEYLLRRGWRKN